MNQISWADIESIVGLKREASVVSVYLPIERKTHPRAQYKTLFKNLAREALAKTPKPSVREDLENIRTWLEQTPVDTTRKTLVIFACAPMGVFKSFQLRKSFPTRLVVDSAPYIRPLLVLLNDLRNYGIVVLDRKKAKFYEVELGDIEKLGEVHNDTHKKVKAGGYDGLDQSRISRRIDNELQYHIRSAAEYLAQTDQGRNFNGLFVQGNQEATSIFNAEIESHFPVLKGKMLGTFHADSDQPRPETLEKCRGMIKQQFIDDEQRAVVQLEQESAAGHMGRAGLGPTLEALNKKNIKTLLVSSAATFPGFQCSNCKALSASEGPCAYCGSPTHPVSDVVADVVAEVIRSGGRVVHVSYSPNFDKNIGIGCLLRFSPAG